MVKKGQASLEFLMSYSWAIVIVAIIIGVLAYSGVMSPEKLLPARCVIPTGSGLVCEDFSVSETGVTMRLKNAINEDIVVESIETTDPPCSYFGGITIPKNSYYDFSLVCLLNKDQKMNAEITLNYRKGAGGLPRSIGGDLVVISPYDTAVNQTICQNAESGGLCDGLDIVYGSGYRDACCGEYGLCCP